MKTRDGNNTIALALVVLSAACSGGTSGGGGTVLFSASGEALAGDGYDFPPSPMGGVFVDGWQIRFTKLIAVFDKVTLSEGANNAVDQSQLGKLVAEINGPWAVDLHKGGPITGKEGDDHAQLIETIQNQNKNGGDAFDPTKLYAFSFDSVVPTAATKTVNFDASDTDYQTMISNGWNVLYVGEATWNGGAAGVTCMNTNPAYDFSRIPTKVIFRFGFKTPTSYINCQNPDNMGNSMFQGEDHPRGVQVANNGATTAQVTFHTDHPFWESFEHDTPAHFDQLAAQAQKQADGSYLVTLDDTKGKSYIAFKDTNGNGLPWRWCDWTSEPDADKYTPPNMNPQMGFDSLSIPEPDYSAYMAYNQSTQGHLNADGLCFVQRHY